MTEKIRSFLAIELNENLYRSLEDLVRKLRSPRYDVRWVSPRNIHLTLRFFGEISSQDIDGVSLAAEKAALAVPPFEVNIIGLGAFPSLRSPRVIWAGIENPDSLVGLEKIISSELSLMAWPPPDKPFRPHITLGRVKSSRGKKELNQILEQYKGVNPGRLFVDHFSLIKSDLKPSGPAYTPLNRFCFARSHDKALT